jgi:hypothetical protein
MVNTMSIWGTGIKSQQTKDIIFYTWAYMNGIRIGET